MSAGAYDPAGKDLGNVSKKTVCNVCKLGYPMVKTINRMIINGQSYVDITRNLSDFKEQGLIKKAPSYSSVANHAKKHISLESKAIRQSIELHARQINDDINSGVDNILGHRAAVDLTMRRGFMLMAEGKINPTVKDMLEATKLLSQYEKEEDDSTSLIELIAQVQRIQDAVKAEVEPEVWERISQRLQSDKPREIDPPIMEAEIVDEDDEEFEYDPRKRN